MKTRKNTSCVCLKTFEQHLKQTTDSVTLCVIRMLQAVGLKNNIVKGIVSDSNNKFLLQQLEDNDEKRLFPKFQFILIFRLQVMHDYVHWYCSIDYCVK